ncbi:MAG TPA: 4Fe-4S binding protein [Anaerolineae bacterium]|nr:4Fe-4S binding protein [Anaerolineae bacterium]
MRIDADTCVGCESCIPYCPMAAISLVEDAGHAVIDSDECVECGVCLRSADCPTEAIAETANPWPRSVRGVFSNPLLEHKETRIPGRGTEEMKTNDVTGRFGRGDVGVAVELGRPGTGTRFLDVQKVTSAMGELGVVFEPSNPVTSLLTDRKRGDINPDILNEKVLSAIVEFAVKLDQLPAVLSRLMAVAPGLETVFSLDVISRVEADGSIPVEGVVRELDLPISVNGKSNCALGKPLASED